MTLFIGSAGKFDPFGGVSPAVLAMLAPAINLAILFSICSTLRRRFLYRSARVARHHGNRVIGSFAPARSARSAAHREAAVEISREPGGGKVPFTEEQLTVMGGLAAEKYRPYLIRKFGK